MRERILVADDEPTVCRIMEHELTAAGFLVTTVPNGEQALSCLKQGPFDVLLLDANMPRVDGFHVLKDMPEQSSAPIVIMITAFGSIENAVQAMKLGAADYITKPFECSVLIAKINQLLHARRRTARQPPASAQTDSTLVGDSPAFQVIRRTAAKVRDLTSNILITGESGTGKGVIAKHLHASSCRAKLPFVHVDCASIQPSLIDSILFGHEKGSFTGAVSTQKGKFELAADGTIFLDEIGVLAPSLQSRLLVVLQERHFSRIGGAEPIAMRARVIAATNEDLEERVRCGDFRKDLYYRLNIIRIHMPPLRERDRDIEGLALHFLNKHAQRNRKTVLGFTSEAMEVLKSYQWPGNIRELENVVESAVVLAESERVELTDIPFYVTEHVSPIARASSVREQLSLAEQEMFTIIHTLELNNGHREKTAEALGISRRALQYKLKKYGLLQK